VRFIEFSTPHIGWKVVITVAAFFSLTGFADVVLFIFAAPAFGITGLMRDEQAGWCVFATVVNLLLTFYLPRPLNKPQLY
jgi:hypothetical protein